MGRVIKTLRVEAALSNHNSEQDEIDSDLWDLFKSEVVKLADDPRFASISIYIV